MTTTAVDGNAAAGALFEAYGREMTLVVATCTACGRAGPLAETVAYLQAPGVVLRCRRCNAVLIVAVSRRGEMVAHECSVRLPGGDG
jgi:phage FluMu protein Com